MQSYKKNIIWHKILDSTSAELRRMGECCNWTVVGADFQTNGRGQGEHIWQSEEGKNLLFSVFLQYGPERRLEAARQELLTMACSLSVADFLSEFGITAKIKKPNDIYVDGKKICGMLIENSLAGKEMKWSIVGMGVNINQTEFPDDLPNPVSLAGLLGCEQDKEKCLNSLLRHLSVRFDAIWSNPEGLEGDYSLKLL